MALEISVTSHRLSLSNLHVGIPARLGPGRDAYLQHFTTAWKNHSGVYSQISCVFSRGSSGAIQIAFPRCYFNPEQCAPVIPLPEGLLYDEFYCGNYIITALS